MSTNQISKRRLEPSRSIGDNHYVGISHEPDIQKIPLPEKKGAVVVIATDGTLKKNIESFKKKNSKSSLKNIGIDFLNHVLSNQRLHDNTTLLMIRLPTRTNDPNRAIISLVIDGHGSEKIDSTLTAGYIVANAIRTAFIKTLLTNIKMKSHKNIILSDLQKLNKNDNHGGIKKIIEISQSDETNEIKLKKIINEGKNRHSRTSSIGGFLKNSLVLHQLSPRSDDAHLLYRALANIDSHLDNKPLINNLNQLLIAQQKDDAIETFRQEIDRLMPSPFVGSGAYGGSRVFELSPDRRALEKINVYRRLINIIKKSDANQALSDVLKTAFNDHPTLKPTLHQTRGWITATSKKVLDELEDNANNTPELMLDKLKTPKSMRR